MEGKDGEIVCCLNWILSSFYDQALSHLCCYMDPLGLFSYGISGCRLNSWYMVSYSAAIFFTE